MRSSVFTGDFAWHAELMKIKERHPEIQNVYPEIGSAFGSLAIQHPVMCQHLIGKNVKVYGVDHVIWGTDCLWWGSPQWVIEAFKRFQISDELCEKFGYRKLTKEDRAKIFGLNAARIYGVHVDEGAHCVVDMTLTSAACPLTDVIADQTNSALEGLVNDVVINWVWMPPWGPDKITDDGREQLRALGFNV